MAVSRSGKSGFLHSRASPRSTDFSEPSCPERFAGPVDPEDPVGFRCYFWPMGDINPRQRELLQIAADLGFLVEVQVSGAFIKK